MTQAELYQSLVDDALAKNKGEPLTIEECLCITINVGEFLGSIRTNLSGAYLEMRWPDGSSKELLLEENQ